MTYNLFHIGQTLPMKQQLLTHIKTSTVQPVKFWEWVVFYITFYWTCDYLSMLGLKLIHTSERGPWEQMDNWWNTKCHKFPILYHDELGYFGIPRDGVATLLMSQCVCYPSWHQYPFVRQSHLEAENYVYSSRNHLHFAINLWRLLQCTSWTHLR